MNAAEHNDDANYEYDPIEGYCVRCRERVEIETPQAVWTRKGMPATRGECPLCGGTVFRMGRTELHGTMQRPQPVRVSAQDDKRHRPQLSQARVYINYAPADRDTAQRLHAELERIGIACWLHEAPGTDDEAVQWAGGVHPALRECERMLLLLSPAALAHADVTQAWTFFREARKPVVIAQIGQAAPPDAIRRSPRFDLRMTESTDYKRAFREMLQALSV